MDEQTERRQTWVCGAHHELVESLRDINQKLDGMIVRQIAYADTSARIEEKQEQIERIVTNGLSHNVANIAKRLDIFCEEVKKRLDELEEFKWFRLPITRLRDSIFWFILKIALAGGAIYLVIHYSGDLIRGITK
jgi:Flp pilus assembly protein TadB